MGEAIIDKKYTDFIDDLIAQVEPLLPEDVNELQKSYLITNMKKSAVMMAESIQDTEEFYSLDIEEQFFYIQVLAEWSFHKEIDLFRSGIPAKYWKIVMQKIWFVMWEVMYACVKNCAPQTVVLSLVERFVNRSYSEAIDELKQESLIDEHIEEQAKEQSNIDKMAQEYSNGIKTVRKIKKIVSRVALAMLISIVVSYVIIKFKTIGLIVILTTLIIYHFFPEKSED